MTYDYTSFHTHILSNHDGSGILRRVQTHDGSSALRVLSLVQISSLITPLQEKLVPEKGGT